jgi:hypothetical protein
VNKMDYKKIMYSVGKLVRCVYGVDVPENVQNMIIRFPTKGIGLINQRGDLIKANQKEVMQIIDEIPGNLKDPVDKMPFEAQGAFWLGYYQHERQ